MSPKITNIDFIPHIKTNRDSVNYYTTIFELLSSYF